MVSKQLLQFLPAIAGGIGLVSFGTLLWKVVHTHNVSSFPLSWILLNFTAQVLVLIYGIVMQAWGIWAPGILFTLGLSYMLYIKLFSQDPPQDDSLVAKPPFIASEHPFQPPPTEPTTSKPTATVPEPTATVPEPTATVPEPTATVPEPTATVPEPTATVPEPNVVMPPDLSPPPRTLPQPHTLMPEQPYTPLHQQLQRFRFAEQLEEPWGQKSLPKSVADQPIPLHSNIQ